MIPKIVHQTWKDANIPSEWKAGVDSVNAYNPDYKHIIWTDETMEAFVKEKYPEFLQTYNSYTYPIQRCDTFRYLVLYTYGGVYMDMDMVCKKELTDLLKYDLVLAKSSNIGGTVTNSFLMSEPNNPFIGYCIEQLPKYVDSFSYFGKHLHVMFSTGPLFLTKMISQYGENKLQNTYFLSNAEYAGDCSVCNQDVCTGGLYFSHLVGNSWHGWDSTCYNFVLCNFTNIIMVTGVAWCLFYFGRRRKKWPK